VKIPLPIRAIAIHAVACFTFSIPPAICQTPASNPATTPTDRLDQTWWADRHKAVLQQVHDHPDTQLLLLGDSITHNYDKAKLPDENFQPTWQQFYASRRALNLGFSGDGTANLLWRLDHGEVEGLHPKVAILLIGTNNTGIYNQTAAETEAGIDAVIADLQRRLPSTHILLLAILPCGGSPVRVSRIEETNRYLAGHYASFRGVTFLDIGSIFFKDGVLNTSIFYDPRLPTPNFAVHPDTNGQRKMAEAIEPTLARLMSDTPHTTSSSQTSR